MPPDNVHVDILSFGDLAALLSNYMEHVKGNDYDVVVILGHSSIFTIGPFSTTEILRTLVDISSPHGQPTIVALLGCCSGNASYGPLSTFQGLQNLNTIFAFYRRNVYRDELKNTSLVLGIRNYLYLIIKKSFSGVTSRVMAKYAFACAMLDLRVCDSDPTAFANDYNNSITMQPYMKKMIFAKFAWSTKEVDSKCNNDLKSICLHVLYECITKLCKNPPNINYHDHAAKKWDDMEGLKFFLFILLGFWGRNSHSDIRDYAYSQLRNMKQKVNGNQAAQNEYNWCAFVFILLCEDSHASVDSSSSGMLNVVCQYSQPFDGNRQLQPLPSEYPALPIKVARNFSWVKFYKDRRIDYRFIMLNHHEIDSINIFDFQNPDFPAISEYMYEYDDFKKALDALTISIATNQPPANYGYCIKPFRNVQQAYFPFSPTINFNEMWIVGKDEESQACKSVSRCRFVFAYSQNRLQETDMCSYEGRLFITYCHYGEDYLPENVVNDILKKYFPDISLQSHQDKVKMLKEAWNNKLFLQKLVINYCHEHNQGHFPFDEIGVLKFTDRDPKNWSLAAPAAT